MNEKIDQLARRLALGRPVDNDGTSNRRSFVAQAARAAAAIGIGAGVTAAPRIQQASAAQCSALKPNYTVAETDGVISDALGTRYVRRGDYIVHGNPTASACTNGGVGTDATYQACGVEYVAPIYYDTYLASGWDELNCRECPFTDSTVLADLYSGDKIGISYGTDQGTAICRGRLDGRQSSVWWRTSGPIGCWFWSGGTDAAVWNETC